MQNGETMMRGVGIGLEGWLVSQEPSFSDPPYIQSTLHSSHSYGKSNTIYARFFWFRATIPIPCSHFDIMSSSIRYFCLRRGRNEVFFREECNAGNTTAREE